MANLKLNVCALVVCMLVMTATRAHGFGCRQVIGKLAPCLGYLNIDGNSSVPLSCCAGVKALNYTAETTAGRLLICLCFKNVTNSNHSTAVAGLPKKCGLNVTYHLGSSSNCSSVL